MLLKKNDILKQRKNGFHLNCSSKQPAPKSINLFVKFYLISTTVKLGIGFSPKTPLALAPPPLPSFAVLAD
jgi:hypothetical protein